MCGCASLPSPRHGLVNASHPPPSRVCPLLLTAGALLPALPNAGSDNSDLSERSEIEAPFLPLQPEPWHHERTVGVAGRVTYGA